MITEISEELQQAMEKHQHLKEYANYYNDNDGDSEQDEYLPKLIVWFRRVLGVGGLDPDVVFDWDEETTDDFYSWGHNSRWNHTFRGEMECNFESYLRQGIELADDYGDPEINYGE